MARAELSSAQQSLALFRPDIKIILIWSIESRVGDAKYRFKRDLKRPLPEVVENTLNRVAFVV